MISTSRLLLRQWRDSDLAPFARLNQDPRVMEFFPKPLTREESDAMVLRIRDHIAREDFGFWAVELKESGDFVGALGLAHVGFEADFVPAVEIAWRMDPRYWGQGLATEGAKAALRFGFGPLDLREIVAFTVPRNRRSLAVMERIGMRRDAAGDFNHPKIPEGDALRRHWLYRILK